jgi:hypothetical protein
MGGKHEVRTIPAALGPSDRWHSNRLGSNDLLDGNGARVAYDYWGRANLGRRELVSAVPGDLAERGGQDMRPMVAERVGSDERQ